MKNLTLLLLLFPITALAYKDTRQPCEYIRRLGRPICIIKPTQRSIRRIKYIAPRIHTQREVKRFIPRNTIRKPIGIIRRVLSRRERRGMLQPRKTRQEKIDAIRKIQIEYNRARRAK